jgi:V/A-type H+-transporting ATPase subunit I
LAVEKMKLISIIGQLESLSSVIEQCCEAGEVQLDPAMSFFTGINSFTTLTEENPYAPQLKQLSESVNSASLSFKSGKSDAPLLTLEEIKAYISDLCSRLRSLQGERQSVASEIERIKRSADQFTHFLGLDLQLDEIFKCQYIKVRFGRLPRESYNKMKEYTNNPYIIYFPGKEDNRYIWGVYFSPIEAVKETDRIFSSLYFERLRIPDAVGTPDEAIEGLERDMQEKKERLKALNKEAEELWILEGPKCSKIYHYLLEHAHAFDLRKYAAKYNDSFILTGWITAGGEQGFKTALDDMNGVDFEIEDAEKEPLHAPPVKLKNKRVFRPFEFFVDMYGLPGYREVDPTAFIAISYFLVFGIMFADVGQGIVLSLISWFGLWKYKKLPLGKIIALCGISSTIFGFLFGSFFGFEHTLNPAWGSIGRLFGISFEHGKPIEVLDSIFLILSGALVLGVGLILTAMLINVYSSIKRRDFGSAFFGPNGLAGICFYASLIIGGAMQFLTGTKVLTPVYVGCLIILPILVMFMYEPLSHLVEGKKQWMPEKWGEYCIQAFFELFEYMLSYVSNTLSFMRISAFVFVHAGMMMAVMLIAGVQEGGALSFGSVIALIIGNIIVIGMEGLLVGIQSLRLEYYELFSRFYIGDGKAFKPVDLSRSTVPLD